MGEPMTFAVATHDLEYKTRDHALRASDKYAWTKYEITARWLSARARAGMVLYNVGCGSGEFNVVAVSAGLKVVACEPERMAFEQAVRTRPQSGCEVRNCGLFDLVPGRDAADLVVMHDVLEHIADDSAAARQLRALLRPGGRLILSVPALPSLFGYHDVLLGHHRRYTKASLAAVVEPYFRIVRMRYFGFSFIPLALWFSKWRKRPYPVETSAGGFKGRIVGALCTLERVVPFPLGTSVIAELEPKP
jgi:2-polyprenyl-3-methyl-5-hydroxy-6-metoxy-1,4-benzoquinol methylase